MEALHGGQVPGHVPAGQEQVPGMPGEEASTGNAGSNPESPEGSEQDVAAAVDEAEKEAEGTNQKLAKLLLTVKQQLPQLMALHDSNPQAYKQSMAMIQKLVQLAHGRKKEAAKSETDETIESLEKAFGRRLKGWKGHFGHKYPVGTRLGRRVKVLIDGKETWRQVASGQVKDARGQDVSVRSSNAVASNEAANQANTKN
jgi:hypothetical protein